MGDIPKFEQLASMQLSIPLMTRESFAQAIGLPPSVIIAQSERGYWPTVKIGKRVFVNVELVRKRALDAEYK
ncbi:hypothetical protein ACN9MZ_14600 [Pseudoduganella sp. S-14]|uniref:hypothetical protein n=1 Tax=Pseudoduganella sp. S-14 TaxID=3404065 RepID=UPI003CFAC952